MKRMKYLSLCLMILLLLTACGKDSTIIRPGQGYTALAEVDGTCYLVENSGILYTLDWDTGEKTVYCKAPPDTAWVAGPDMQHIYYMEGSTLHCIDIAADQDTALCEMPMLEALRQPFLAATDHFLLYQQVHDAPSAISIWCLDLETLATRRVFSAEQGIFDVFLAAREDTIYINFYNTGPTDQDRHSRISAIDLVTGKEVVLEDVKMKAYTPVPYNPLFNTFCNVMTDDLLFYENGRYYINDDPRDYSSETAVCAVPLDGSAGNHRLAFTGAIPDGRMLLSTDARLLVNYGTENPVLTLYRYDVQTDSAAELAQIKSLTRAYCAVTNGQRYAMLAGGDNTITRLILGNLE